jgi:hypothetical protein
MLNWVVQKQVFEENYKAIKSVLKDRVIKFDHRITGAHFERDPGMGFIFYGSIAAGRQLQRTHNAICWLYDDVYDCSYYMHHFKGFLLNEEHSFITTGFSEEYLLDKPDMFIKENKGYKSFTGCVYDEMAKYEISKLDKATLLLVAPKKEVDAEWRFVISDSKILTFSQYGSRIHPSDDGAVEFVNMVVNRCLWAYDPAPIWTLDVAISNGRYYVLEVNSLLSAGWYNCEVEKIINAVDTAMA